MPTRLFSRRAIAAACLILFVFLPERASAQASDSDVAGVETAPVEIDGRVLFRVRGVSSLPAAERARRIRERVTAVADDRTIPVESFRIVEADGMSRIQAGDQLLFGMVDADAALEQVDRGALAAAHMAQAQQLVTAYRAARTPALLWRGALRSLIATPVLLVATFIIVWLGRRSDRLIMARLRARLEPVGIESLQLRARRLWDALRVAFGAVRTLLILTLVLVYLGYVFAQFPWTRGLSRNMAGFVLTPLRTIGAEVLASIPSLVFLTVLFLLVRVGLKMIRLFFTEVERGAIALPAFEAEWAQPTYNLVRVAIIAFALIVAYPYIPGSGSAAFQGVSLFLGLVFSLGSSTAISNTVAGYMLIYRRAFKVGDRIRIGDSEGMVTATRLQVTHIRTFKNEELIIPNSQILAGEVMNFSTLGRAQGVILHSEVGIGYATPWRQVEAMLLEAARRVEGLGTDPRPFVLLKKLGDFAVTYEINVFTTNVERLAFMYAELHRHVLDVFNEYGVQIMTPAYEGDPSEPKVVPPEQWYTAPAKATP